MFYFCLTPVTFSILPSAYWFVTNYWIFSLSFALFWHSWIAEIRSIAIHWIEYLVFKWLAKWFKFTTYAASLDFNVRLWLCCRELDQEPHILPCFSLPGIVWRSAFFRHQDSRHKSYNECYRCCDRWPKIFSAISFITA